MNVRKLSIITVGASVIAALITGCGDVGQPVNPAPIGSVERPQPANVGGVEPTAEKIAPNGCDTRSLAPSTMAISDGSTMAEIRNRGKLIAGVDQTTFLFGFRNPTTSNLEGFDIDMAKHIAAAIFGSAEGHIQFRAITSSQREAVLEKEEVDIVVRTYTINCERLQKINFSSEYYTAGQRVLVSKNSPVTSLAELGGQKVCAARGSTSLTTIAQTQSKPIPVSVDNWSDCLVLLQQNQVAAISTDDVILAGMAEQDPTTHIVGERFTREPYGIGIPKKNEDMVKFVNAVLEKVRAGAWKQSYDRWLTPLLGSAEPPKPQYR